MHRYCAVSGCPISLGHPYIAPHLGCPLLWSHPMAPRDIHDAAREHDVETLRRLLAEGVSPDALVDQQVRRRPLHCLCLRDDEKNEGDRAACFELLRDAGANLEAGDQIGYTILHLAARDAFPELLSLLVQKPALIWMRHSRLVPQRCTSQHAMGLSIASKCSWPQALL